jgi:hypothetical protein
VPIVVRALSRRLALDVVCEEHAMTCTCVGVVVLVVDHQVHVLSEDIVVIISFPASSVRTASRQSVCFASTQNAHRL